MQKIALILEYDGSQFHGWQKQGTLRTVQLCLEQALTKVAAQPITTICAGRTDAGVHAFNQVVHFETEVIRPEKAWCHGTNTFLPADIRIHEAKKISLNFHARFSAKARRYQYVIINQGIRPAIFRSYVCWEARPLDIAPMNEAAHDLLGELDFSSFRAAECQARTPFRRIDHLLVSRHANYVVIDIKANAFLHHMVRNIAGVLLAIGTGERSPQWTKAVLAAKDRCAAGVTSPAGGLYLVEVDYPEQYEIVKFTDFISSPMCFLRGEG